MRGALGPVASLASRASRSVTRRAVNFRSLRRRPSGRISSLTMSDERDKKEDPAEELKQGLSHLWKAARGVATEVKKEVERTDIGKALDGAGRDFVRAAANVVD